LESHLLICAVKPGIDKARVFDAVKSAHAVLRQLPGFLRHEIAAGTLDDDGRRAGNGDGQWIDVVHWRDREAAGAAEARFRADPTIGRVAEAIDLRWIRVLPMACVPNCADVPLAS
jgi:hypothetical protein